MATGYNYNGPAVVCYTSVLYVKVILLLSLHVNPHGIPCLKEDSSYVIALTFDCLLSNCFTKKKIIVSFQII